MGSWYPTVLGPDAYPQTVVIDALYARSHGGMVSTGPNAHLLRYPWWIAAGAGVSILALCLYAIWRMASGRD